MSVGRRYKDGEKHVGVWEMHSLGGIFVVIGYKLCSDECLLLFIGL